MRLLPIFLLAGFTMCADPPVELYRGDDGRCHYGATGDEAPDEACTERKL